MAKNFYGDESGKDETSRVESPEAIYHFTPMTGGVVNHWITVLRQLGMETSAKAGGSLAQIREALKIGAPRGAFDHLRAELGVTTEEFADVLGIPTRTLARRTDRFKPDESERLMRVGSVLLKAVDVLEDRVAARRWMTQPKRALGGFTPLRCCDTEMGAREAEALLGRIEHGVFS
jgi:putative toxin-antitoxin system antitoxin component (TIGR02293 family)